MIVATLDWIIILAYFVVSIGIGIYMSKRAGRSTGDFFLSGRNLPWYIAGTSMVATTFAADTPLAITEMVADNGIAGNWLWWNMLFGGMLTVFFFSRLWRRAGILTDNEFVSIRYAGKPARFLRGFRSIYIGIFMNVIVIGWVNLAMVKILRVMFPDLLFLGIDELSVAGFTFSSHLLMVGVMMFFVAIYSSLSGLMGVSLVDTFQFVMAMTGTIILAIFAVNHADVGGISGLKAQLPEWVFQFTPEIGGEEQTTAEAATGLLKMSAVAFIAYIGVQWWASWYPGAEPGGGGYVAQRMMSAKDEKHSLFATLWFQIAHFAVRPWPWIITALATLVLYPDLPIDQKGDGFVMAIRDLMPTGLLGLLMAAFFAAYMSTIASQTVWGTSYIINDFFRPFIKKNASEKYYVKVSRVTTFLLLLLSLVVTSKLDRISDAWRFILACSGGIGLVLIFRWFWWRINAWSEIAALIAPYLIYPFLHYHFGLEYEISLLIIVAWSTVVWLTVTFLTKPEKEETLRDFYRKVHPARAGWKRIADQMPDVTPDKGYGYLFVNWIAGSIMIMSTLFGIGKLIFQEYTAAIIFLVVAAIGAFIIYRNMSKIGWKKIAK